MISVSEATDIILSTTLKPEIEEVALSQAIGRILMAPITADRDFPPYDRVTMDGIGINYTSFANGKVSFPIDDIQFAGEPAKSLSNPAHCLEVMTGAICPPGIDTVIPFEWIKIEEQNGRRVATLVEKEVKQHQNIHAQGLDRKQGELLADIGANISPAEIAVAASVGKTHLSVAKPFKVALITSGDELVPVSENPLPHQIRTSNVPMIHAALREMQIEADNFHFQDNRQQIQDAMAKIIDEYDVLILSGGVSRGKADHIPAVMEALGVEKLFHKIRQRPGKPLWFGKIGDKTRVFALPGNPVSTFVGFNRYVRPWLVQSMGGKTFQPMQASLIEDFQFGLALTYFLQVKINTNAVGKLIARPVDGHGSGDFANMLRADGFLELPEEKDLFRAGEVYNFIPFRNWKP